MRQTIINSLDLLIWIFGGLMMLSALAIGLMTMATNSFFGGLALILLGAVYTVIFMGMFFLVIGIHDNTRRTAEALERAGIR